MDSNSIPKFKDRKSLGVLKCIFSGTTQNIPPFSLSLSLHGDSKILMYAVPFLKQFMCAIFVLFSEETKDLELTFISKCISAVEKRG